MIFNLRLVYIALLALGVVGKNCNVCPGGLSVPNPDLPLDNSFYPELNGLTCGGIQTDPNCVHLLSTYSLDFVCGCPGSEQKCSLCPAGAVGYPDLVLAEFFAPGPSITCAEFDNAKFAIFDQATCAGSFPDPLDEFRLLCGCSGFAPTCTLCEDRSPLLDPNMPVFQTDYTCRYVEQFFGGYVVETPKECTALQATAGVACNCNNPVASGGACRICNADSTLDSFQTVEWEGANRSCSELEFLANLPGDTDTCQEYKSMFKEQCCAIVVASPLQVQSSQVQTNSSNSMRPKILFSGFVVAALAALI